jgi:hypothetical protein
MCPLMGRSSLSTTATEPSSLDREIKRGRRGIHVPAASGISFVTRLSESRTERRARPGGWRPTRVRSGSDSTDKSRRDGAALLRERNFACPLPRAPAFQGAKFPRSSGGHRSQLLPNRSGRGSFWLRPTGRVFPVKQASRSPGHPWPCFACRPSGRKQLRPPGLAKTNRRPPGIKALGDSRGTAGDSQSRWLSRTVSPNSPPSPHYREGLLWGRVHASEMEAHGMAAAIVRQRATANPEASCARST